MHEKRALSLRSFCVFVHAWEMGSKKGYCIHLESIKILWSYVGEILLPSYVYSTFALASSIGTFLSQKIMRHISRSAAARFFSAKTKPGRKVCRLNNEPNVFMATENVVRLDIITATLWESWNERKWREEKEWEKRKSFLLAFCVNGSNSVGSVHFARTMCCHDGLKRT